MKAWNCIYLQVHDESIVMHLLRSWQQVVGVSLPSVAAVDAFFCGPLLCCLVLMVLLASLKVVDLSSPPARSLVAAPFASVSVRGLFAKHVAVESYPAL